MKIIQISNSITKYDAVSNQILAIKKTTENLGYDNIILVKWKDQNLKDESIITINSFNKPRNLFNNYNDDIIIFHHHSKSLLVDLFKKLKGKKILFYHNITPPYFFQQIDTKFASDQQNGLDQLKILKSFCDLAIGSRFSINELKEIGFSNIHEFTFYFDWNLYSKKNLRDTNYYKTYDNIIFVGRIAPNKKHDDLIKIFYYYSNFINPNSRLFLTGQLEQNNSDPYQTKLKHLIKKLDLENKVIFTGLINQEELVSLYRLADVFVCMSEHEGFCLPIIESMLMNIPVIAFNSTAIPYTMKNSGILVNNKDHKLIAQLMYKIIKDKKFRSEIISNQSEVVQSEYTYNKFKNSLLSLIKNVSN